MVIKASGLKSEKGGNRRQGHLIAIGKVKPGNQRCLALTHDSARITSAISNIVDLKPPGRPLSEFPTWPRPQFDHRDWPNELTVSCDSREHKGLSIDSRSTRRFRGNVNLGFVQSACRRKTKAGVLPSHQTRPARVPYITHDASRADASRGRRGPGSHPRYAVERPARGDC